MNPDNVVLSLRSKMLRVRLVVPDNVTPSSSQTIDSTGGDDSKTISKVSDHIISQTVREKGLVCFRTAATLMVTSRSSSTVFGLASVLQMALTLLVILLSIPPAFSEVVFHRRDHTDQGNYGASPPSYNVRSYSEALVYLHKYGYLSNCTLPVRRRRRHQPFQLPFSPGEGSLMRNDAGSSLPEEHICSDFEVRSALRRLQQRFDLDASGRLDDDTKLLMSRGRCGNTDSDDRRRQLEAEPQTTLREVDSVGDSNGEDPSGNEIGHETNRRLERGRRHRKRRSPSSSSSSSSSGSTSSAGSRGATGSRGIADFSGQVSGQPPSPLIDIDALFEHIVPPEPVNQIELSRRRRMEQLREMTTLRQQQEERQQRDSVGVVSNKAKDTTTPSGGELVTGGSGIIQQLQQLVQESRFDEQLQRIQEHRRRRRKRRRRSISFTSFADHVLEGPSSGVEKDQMRFRKDDDSPVQWRLLDGGVSGKIPLKDQHDILELAFRMWSEVIPLRFSETNDMVAVQDTDIIIAFAKQDHMNCDKPFDGNGGELAHSWTGGDIHFDEDENYRRDDPSGSGINLLKVAVHEIGHVLGLLHTDRGESIMYPIYVNPAMYDSFELARDDRRAVQNIYGVCKGTFDVVFDWLRKVRSPDGASIRYIFNTYFFRSSRYWMYENRFNRTRYGDPLYVSREWTGLPNTIDAYVQIITSSGSVASGSRPPEYLIDTYFFSGDSYYKYDDEMDRVSDGYPRKIAAGFGPKPGGTDAVPNSLDAVLFDNRDSLLYFFKGDWVWVYNPRDIGRNSCCERKVTFSSLFPLSSVDSITEYTSSSSSNSSSLPSSTAAATDHPSQAISLTGNISAVFYSYHFRSMFVFDGETVYENVAYDEHTPGVNRLVRRGPWYNIWFDICDVD